MIATIIALALQVTPAPRAQADAASDPQIIIVYGRRLEDDLAACLARECPPKEDIEASIQAAVFQFGAGRYAHAATTLRKSIRRNRAFEAQHPGELSSLYATLATVLQHDGHIREMAAAARNSVEILRRRAGAAHPGTLREELVLGDALVRRGHALAAERKYQNVARTAEAGGQPLIAASAQLRVAWLAVQQQRYEVAAVASGEARRVSGGNADVELATAVIALRERVARGDDGAIEQLIRKLAARPRTDLRLVSAPSYPDFEPGETGIRVGPPNPAQLRFADIGFWVRTDGTVEDVSYLRGQHLGQYQKALLAQVRGRRYAPFVTADAQPGMYRIERVTVRGDWATRTDSRIPTRSEVARIEVADLTATQELADKSLNATPASTAPGASAGMPAP